MAPFPILESKMPKIKITTDRTWVHGKKAVMGEVYDVTDEEATVLMANGFGEKVATKVGVKASKKKYD